MIERFRNAAPMQQILVVLALGAAVALLLGVVWFQFLRVTYKPLFSELQPADAAAIIAELEKRKIPYQLSEGGKTILVPAAEADAARINVVGNDLPIKGTVGFELFNKSDMGLTDFAQKINYQRALQGELTRTIMSLDGVESARVHLSLGEDRVFKDDRVPPKASVAVHMENGRPIDDREADGIRRVVAAAVSQLDAAQVVVVDETGEIAGSDLSAEPVSALTPLMQEKRAIEQYYEAKVRQAITARYPAETIGVTVWASKMVSATDQSGEASGETEDGTPWVRTARDFRLQITLAPAGTVSQEVLADMRQLAGTAIGYDATLGDAIIFGPAPLAPANSLSRAERRLPHSSYGNEAGISESSEVPSSGFWRPVPVLILMTMLGGVVLSLFILGQRRPGRRLTADQREAFAAKLESLLEEGGTHV